MKSTIKALGLVGLLALAGCGDKGEEEMEKYGFRHLSANKIEYRNGFVAEGLDKYGNGTFDEIEVTTYLDWGTLESSNLKPSGKLIYHKGDKDYSEIEEAILGKTPPLKK